MTILIIIIYLVIGIIVALYELNKVKKFREQNPSYYEEFTLLHFVMTVIMWPVILMVDIDL